jgi:hypothetical protein
MSVLDAPQHAEKTSALEVRSVALTHEQQRQDSRAPTHHVVHLSTLLAASSALSIQLKPHVGMHTSSLLLLYLTARQL